MTEFKETQRFTQWWLWLILFGTWAIMIFALLQEVNEINMSFFIGGFIGLGLPIFFWQMRLVTRVTSAGIYVRFIPFHFKEQFYPWDSIESAQVRTYDSLFEYGGWGIKYGFSGQGKVYNVSGDQGLQLVFKSGEKILIGTHKPEEIQAAVPL
ncbi:hypothetical protein [Aquirufa sp.]|jgi:hypothetical protein|uniref:hypothetical protein n=1 Tax=Aquirufa sp. TaxID=2676249 RepID=UPI0037C0BB76